MDREHKYAEELTIILERTTLEVRVILFYDAVDIKRNCKKFSWLEPSSPEILAQNVTDIRMDKVSYREKLRYSVR